MRMCIQSTNEAVYANPLDKLTFIELWGSSSVNEMITWLQLKSISV